MTPEEKAVIEAAERVPSILYCNPSHAVPEPVREWSDLVAAVMALRESRKPKPKWRTRDSGYPPLGAWQWISSESLAFAIACESRALRDRVIKLLNDSEPA